MSEDSKDEYQDLRVGYRVSAFLFWMVITIVLVLCVLVWLYRVL